MYRSSSTNHLNDLKNHSDQDNRCFNVKCPITGVKTEYKTEIMGGPEFLHGNTGVRYFFYNVITGTIYKDLYRKWFDVLSFQCNNRYNVISSQLNENTL